MSSPSSTTASSAAQSSTSGPGDDTTPSPDAPHDGVAGTSLPVTAPQVDGGDLEPTTPPLIGPDGRVRLSFSRIDTLRQCSLKFRYRYIDRLPSQPATYLSFGTSVHSALELFHQRTLFGRPDLADLHQFLFDNWDSTGYAQVPRDRQVEDYHRARHTLTRYHDRVGDQWQPAADTEKWFELPVGDTAMVVGSIDRVDVDAAGDLHVVDYKTGKLRDRQKVRGSLQLSIYALAVEHLYGRLPATVALDYVVADMAVVVPVDELDLAEARRAVIEAAEVVRAQAWEPVPTRLCDWCDFQDACPAWEGDGSQVLGRAVVERDGLRRSLARDLARLRALEQGIDDMRTSLRTRGLDPVGEDPADTAADTGPATDPADSPPSLPMPGQD